MNNVILIGMPACGKSTVGVVLAKTMGKAFVDTDLLIQQDQQALLQTIIDEKGNDYFQTVERQILATLDVDQAVISTGGSAVYYDEAMKHLKQIGTIVYLALPLATIKARLKDINTRGITIAPGETLPDLYDKRTPLYEHYADITVAAEGLTVEQVVEIIIRQEHERQTKLASVKRR